MSSSSQPSYAGYVDPNFPNPGGENSAPIIIYGYDDPQVKKVLAKQHRYTPSLIVCVLGLALFALALPIHVYLLIRHRTWYFSTVVVGTAMELVGYSFRTLSSQRNPYSVSYFVGQYFFIITAPVFYSAAIYAIVSVLINTYGRRHAPLPPVAVLAIFIACDVVATVVQVTGAALVGAAYSNERDPTGPNNILLAGLAFQVFAFFIFLLVLAATLFKGQRNSSERVPVSFLLALVAATCAVYLRTCFRLAETAEGLMQKLSTNEVFFGCLEFAPIVVAVYLFTYWHPGRWLSASIKPTGNKESRTRGDGSG